MSADDPNPYAAWYPCNTGSTTTNTTTANTTADHARFLHNLLNPSTSASSTSASSTSASFTSSSSTSTSSTTTSSTPAMSRPGRLSNGYVDLTANDSPPRRRKRTPPVPGPSKRQKRDHSPSHSPVDQIDLSQDDDILGVLNKQREDAIKAQAKPVETVTTFNSFNCVICMDRPTDITATACGHLFCHTCLMEALIAGEARAGPGETKRSQCPVCRKTISRNRPTDVIPLLLKKGLATQPRRKLALVPESCTQSELDYDEYV